MRNRLRLIDAASDAFRVSGKGVTLEQIARDAGVGIATLYRHFPTIEALVEGVYAQQVDELSQKASELADAFPPIEALRRWLVLYTDFMGTKQNMGDALNAIVGGTSQVYNGSGARMDAAISLLLNRAIAGKKIHMDVEPLDLLRAVTGVALLAPSREWKSGTHKVIDVLIKGLTSK